VSEGAPRRRLGVITNPLSRSLRAGRYGLRAAEIGAVQAAPASLDELRSILAGFAADGVDLLVVQGGDGTLREVLTALPGTFGAHPPEIAVLSAGKTNLAARSLGSAGSDQAALQRLRDAAARGSLRRHRQPVLEVTRLGAAEVSAPLRGLLFGAGAVTEATRMAERRLHRSGIRDGLAVALAIAGVALRAVRPGSHPLRDGVPAAVAPDGMPPETGHSFLVLATPLDRLMLGLWPFWDVGQGPVRWLDVAAPPRRLMAALWAARSGRPRRPWMPAAGYRSGRAHRVTIRLAAPFVLDGEIFMPGTEGVELSAPGCVTFVAP